jgi:hypothetical protein
VNPFAEATRIDNVPADFLQLGAGQKPGAVFLNDFFASSIPPVFERIAQRAVRSTHLTGNPLGLTSLTRLAGGKRIGLGFVNF